MYLPYLRGKQNELLALQELLDNELIGDKILPIIEPVNLGSTFINTIKKFIEKENKIAVVQNDIWLENSEKLKEIEENQYFIKSFIVNQNINIGENNKKIILINEDRDSLELYKENLEKDIMYSLIPDDRNFKRNATKPILFEDNYNKLEKNIDYAKKDDEYFSDISFYFKKDGYEGFSDYSIIGKDMPISGFAPRAVALHIMYKKDKELRVKHFISDSNDDIRNPAKKFQEAAKKMCEWLNNKSLYDSKYPIPLGLRKLKGCYEEEKYPGLGVIKKYSIMNHLELVNQILMEHERNENIC